MNRHQQHRIKQARAMVRHCHNRIIEWAHAPESVGVRAFAVAHYAQHKARYLAELQTLIHGSN